MPAFQHIHPYPPFLFEAAQKWIVGTLPPPRFTQGLLRPGDVDFSYGSRDGQLWPILDHIFNLDLAFETTTSAIEQRQKFLKKRQIGICDIVERAQRDRIDASDLGMKSIQLRDLFGLLVEYPRVTQLLFTGGNSKNGPEYLFRRLLKDRGVRLEQISDKIPRIHQFMLPRARGGSRKITTVSLTAPSGAANRSVGGLAAYKQRKAHNPQYTTLDFRIEQYRKYF